MYREDKETLVVALGALAVIGCIIWALIALNKETEAKFKAACPPSVGVAVNNGKHWVCLPLAKESQQ